VATPKPVRRAESSVRRADESGGWNEGEGKREQGLVAGKMANLLA